MARYDIMRFRATAKHLDPKSLIFSVFTADDIRKLSVKKITTSDSFNMLGHPLSGGLHDPALGPLSETSEPCRTCGDGVFRCSGHFGHIDLPMPVVNPLFHKALQRLLKLSCLNCFTLQFPSYEKLLLSAKLRLLEEGHFSHIDSLDQEVMSAVPDPKKIHETSIPYIQDIIESYIQNVHNIERFKVGKHSSCDFNLNTKNKNVQRHTYIDNFLSQHKSRKVCINCNGSIQKITVLKNKIMTYKVHPSTDETCNQKLHKLETTIVMPDQSKEYMQKLWQNDKEVLKLIIPCLNNLNVENPTDVFFFEVIPVLPPIVRPINFLRGHIIEHPQTQVYRSIIINCLSIRNIIQAIQDGGTNKLPDAGKIVFNNTRGNTPIEKLHNVWQDLQANVDHLMDRDLSKTSDSANCQGIKQIIDKKEGVIRMHMMGKRVNFAARSVITPDPNLNIDEIGIPEAFATKLTYPVPVTPWNVAELRQLVLNGPDVHPGAVMVEGEDGFIRRLTSNYELREATAKRLLTMTDKANKFFQGVKIVHRHLQNGDILLLNRQPTLHKPSIMAHKARILKGEKTLRLHYANCKAYNADFDGDEMNAHFPQHELARSEGYHIANVPNQYLVPKDGTPLSGLIQDHVIAGVKMTLRGKFFHKEDYMQLIFSALSVVQGNLILLPPAILKPIPMWSGKQVISTIIINIIPRGTALINLTASANIGVQEWQVRKPRAWKCGTEFKNHKTMSEAEVIIRNGELLCGVLDKKHYGATPFGLIHCVFELYGGPTSNKLLSAFGKVSNVYLQINGFTLGIQDILVTNKAGVKRTEIINECRKIGESIQRSVLEVPEDTQTEVVVAKMEENYSLNPKFRAQVDRKYKTALDVYTNKINKTCLSTGLIKTFPENNLQLMVQSGAKGSTVNTMQISCLLGQTELAGKRPPLMISGKSLPSFPAYDPTPRAGGFIDGRFMTGLRPQEFFFHSMAGREGLIDTAVKTSNSGYLQRSLIKNMEGLMINYDATVRDSDGSLVQIYYGEDGLDIPKSRFLNENQLEFLIENKNAIADENLLKHLKKDVDLENINKQIKKIHKWKKKNGDLLIKHRISKLSKFSADHANPNSSKNEKTIPNYGRSKARLSSLVKKWIQVDDETKNLYKVKCVKCPDPLIAKYRQDLKFGVLPERIEGLLDNYLKKKATSFATNIRKEEFRDVLCAKVMNTLCPPGEPVGILAAQSIGEPSTQMTLNTFHFAGRGDMNVTLGIPRLKEILMTASQKIKTPSMEIPFKKDLPNLTKESNELRLKLTKCYVANVLKNIKVERKLNLHPERQIHYTITIEYLSHNYYKNEFCVHPAEIIEKTETILFKEIFKEIKKTAKINTFKVYYEEEKKQTKDEDSRLDEEVNEDEMNESSDEDEDVDIAMYTNCRKDNQGDSEEDKEQSEEDEEQPEEDKEQPEEDEEQSEEVENVDEKKNRLNKTVENKVDDEEIRLTTRSINRDQYIQRKHEVFSICNYILDYDYDVEKNQWCKLKFWLPLELTKLNMPEILGNVAKRTVLSETPAINRAFTFQNLNGETVLKTDGINIVEMFKYEKMLDLNRLYSNDIYGISQTYGIEAANRVIIKEVKDVFKMYGITVDTRHLSLVADYMTFGGRFQPLSRKGMEDLASPLQQMSFESSLNFLKDATLQGKRDDLFSPSSRLMIGQPCKSGTGSFSLLLDLQQQINQHRSQPLAVVN